MVQIHLIDCGIGNIGSVSNAFEFLGYKIIKCSSEKDLKDCEILILPGVGSFKNGIDKLKKNGLDKAIIKAAEGGCKILGICLGMQLLLDKSYEFGEHEGLRLIQGEVKKMPVSESGLRLPHIGWNDVKFIKNDDLMKSLNNPTAFYFVNSYYCECSNEEDVLGIYNYKKNFPAIIRKKNLIGVQFHPEKSHKDGLKLLKNFIEET